MSSSQPGLGIGTLDHLVLTVSDLKATREFYVDALGMELRTFGSGRHAFHFGGQKINLHIVGSELEPKAGRPTPGSADLCFLIRTRVEDAAAHLETYGYPVVEGPVQRTGAVGPIRSIYTRDPDGNLIELANTI